MVKLVVVVVFDPITEVPDRVFEEFDAPTGFKSYDAETAERRAIRWLEHRPNDIVMLVES